MTESMNLSIPEDLPIFFWGTFSPPQLKRLRAKKKIQIDLFLKSMRPKRECMLDKLIKKKRILMIFGALSNSMISFNIWIVATCDLLLKLIYVKKQGLNFLYEKIVFRLKKHVS